MFFSHALSVGGIARQRLQYPLSMAKRASYKQVFQCLSAGGPQR